MATTKAGIESPVPQPKSLSVPVKSYPGSGSLGKSNAKVIDGPASKK